MRWLANVVGGRSTHFVARHRVRRLKTIYVLAGLWMSLVVVRLFSLQVSDVERWRDWALKQHKKVITYSSERAPIYDRWNRPLAKSIPVESLYAHPRKIKDPAALAEQLAPILEVEKKELERSLSSSAAFVWVARHLPRVKAQKISRLEFDGSQVGLIEESRRAYPYRGAAGVLLGRVGMDGDGLSGLEQYYDSRLKGSKFKAPAMRDGRGNYISPATEILSPESDGSRPLRLTLDAEIQAIMTSELLKGAQEHSAKSVTALMVDAHTGEVLGMAQAPTVNLNEQKISSRSALRNLVVENVFEPGSVMKPFIAAVALEKGLVRTDELFDCENGRLRFGGHTIRDSHPLELASFREVVVRSSNIGMAKVAERLGRQGVYDALRLFGFGSLTSLGLPGETAGILRSKESWAEIDIATHAFGQGVAVTALQSVRAMAAVANGGHLIDLRLIEGQAQAAPRRVISEFTASQVRSILRGVVDEDHGTGSRAGIPGVVIGGKTGTAQKARTDGRGYAPGKYVASFLGYIDGSSVGVPRTLAMMVVVDEPNGRSIYGGTLAAPIFRAIAQRTLRYLTTSKELRETTPSIDLDNRSQQQA